MKSNALKWVIHAHLPKKLRFHLKEFEIRISLLSVNTHIMY